VNDMSKPEARRVEKARPQYQPPHIQVMEEKDILTSFQITQSMGAWWAGSVC